MKSKEMVYWVAQHIGHEKTKGKAVQWATEDDFFWPWHPDDDPDEQEEPAEMYVKVGKTINLYQRMAGLKTGSPFELTLLGADFGSEEKWHERLRAVGCERVGEWFKSCPNLWKVFYEFRDHAGRHIPQFGPVVDQSGQVWFYDDDLPDTRAVCLASGGEGFPKVAYIPFVDLIPRRLGDPTLMGEYWDAASGGGQL